MNDLRQAAQQALELLRQLQGGCTDSDDGTVEAITVWCPEVIANLEAALEQDDKDRVWIEERKAAWAKDKEIARKNAELERERHYTPGPCNIAADGVCEALECCKEQEPVAWMWEQQARRSSTGIGGWDKQLLFCCPAEDPFVPKRNITPLYTHPPRREWRGLTAGEIGAISDSIERSDFFDIVIPFARAIEAALKEKNA